MILLHLGLLRTQLLFWGCKGRLFLWTPNRQNLEVRWFGCIQLWLLPNLISVLRPHVHFQQHTKEYTYSLDEAMKLQLKQSVNLLLQHIILTYNIVKFQFASFLSQSDQFAKKAPKQNHLNQSEWYNKNILLGVIFFEN